MIIALVVVAVLLFVAVVLLSNAFGSVSTENSIRAKIAAFDAAEAGINQAVEVLDKHRTSLDCASNGGEQTTGSLADGGTYSWCIQYNGVLQGAGKVTDHADGRTEIDVPSNTVYAWSLGTAQDGGRGVLIEALIAPSNGISLPSGAVVAGGDVYSRGDVGLYESGALRSDASIRANGSLYAPVRPRVVQGVTYAGGTDQINGVNGTNPNSPLMSLPPSERIAAASQNASNEASSGAAAISPPDNSAVLPGNVYIEGNLDLKQGAVVFQHGRAVFVDGNLCIHGAARVVNDGATIWVAGAVSTVGTGGSGYSIAPGSGGTLIALGTGDGRVCGNSGGKYAVALESKSTLPIGFVYAPNGSIDLSGTGRLVGALDAGRDVYLDSTQGGGVVFDPSAVQPIPTYDFKVVSYMEY